MQRLYYNDELIGGCPAARGQIAVSSDGVIYPCTSFLGIDTFRLGTIDTGIDSVAYTSFIKMLNKRFLRCQECIFFTICKTTGSCLNMNYYFNKNPIEPHKESCALFQEKLRLAIATLAILEEKIPDKIEELFGYDPVGRRGNTLY